jgi:predicted nucleic acid-binding protein
MANRILVDTGFWYAVFNKQDCHTGEAEILMDKYFDKPAYEIVVPFPTMYELLRTKFVKNKKALDEIRQLFHSGRITRIDDDLYRSDALELTLGETRRNISLVDNIIRLILDDKNIGARGLITFNVGDFQDVCQKNRIEILY